MKDFLTGVAVFAALAFSAPAWAQPASPSSGNPMGMPVPNPGGAGLTPYSTGGPSPPTAQSTSTMPPKHHARPARTAAHHRGKAPQPTDSTANQLNQQELARQPVPAPRGSARSPAGGPRTD